jgi:hypothetical protein
MSNDNTIKQHVDELRADLDKINEGLQKIRESGLTEKAVLLLMHHYTGLPQKTIKAVMDGLMEIEDYYFEDSE